MYRRANQVRELIAIKSIFQRFFKPPEQGPSVADIDAETEAAVRSIETRSTIDVQADRVLETGWGKPGDMVYIMDLEPIYKIIGSRTGRTATNLRESCKSVFAKYVLPGKGKAGIVGDSFFLRFYTLGESEGFHRAAVITNEIGTGILGDRFAKLDVPDLIIAADAQDITNSDGSLNEARSASVIRSGGAKIAKTPKERLKSVQVAYYPTWSPATEMVETFACYARRKTSKGLVYGNAVYPESAADPLSILIDGKVSKLAVRDMATLAHFNWRVKLFLPLRYATLTSRHAAGIAQILNDISPAWRNQHLIFEILNLEDKVTADQLGAVVKWAHKHGCGAAVRTGARPEGLDRIAESGATYACVDYGEETTHKPDFKDYVAQAHARGLTAAIWNVSENGSLEGMLEAGFDLMNGTAVISPTGAVDNRRELARNHVMMGY